MTTFGDKNLPIETRYLSQIDEQARHETFLYCMTFQRTAHAKDPTVLEIMYKCDADECDFTTAISAISMNIELRACHSQDTVKLVVKDIQKHPEISKLCLYDK